LDWPTKIRMAKDISSGVNHLHDANIVNCDLVRDFSFLSSDRQVGTYSFYNRDAEFPMAGLLESEYVQQAPKSDLMIFN
ncbi:12175_t:CDS:1, partial [Racocetra persica]